MIELLGEEVEVEEEVNVKMIEKTIEEGNLEIKGDLMIKREDPIKKDSLIKMNIQKIQFKMNNL